MLLRSTFFSALVEHFWTISILLTLLPSRVESAGRFSVTPQRTVYIREGETVSLKWEYSIDNGDTFQGMIWTSYDPPGSSLKDDQFRLAVKGKSGQPSKTLPDKSRSLKGVSLYEGRVKIKDQATLEITNVTLDNMYVASLIYNDYGSTVALQSEPVRVIPTVPPQITSNSFSSPLDVIEGNDIIVNCSATGKPPPNVTWTNSISGVKLNQSVSSALLVINNIRRNSDKNFLCTANSVGNTALKNLKLNVLYKPVIDLDSSSKNVTSWDNSEVELKCLANGLPSPDFQWLKPGGQPVTRGTSTIHNGKTLTVKTTAPGDYGEYKCLVTNVVGTTDHSINVEKWDKPNEPSSVTVKENEPSYVRLTWTAPSDDGGSPVVDYKIRIENNQDPTDTKELKNVTETETLVDQLTAGATYSVWVRAGNIVGYGDFAFTSFTTKKIGKPGIPVIGDVNEKISATSMELSWSAAAENGAPIITYTIWRREVDSNKGVGQWSKQNTTSNDLTYTVVGLEFGKTYQFGVTAWNKYGESALDERDGRLKQVEIIFGGCSDKGPNLVPTTKKQTKIKDHMVKLEQRYGSSYPNYKYRLCAEMIVLGSATIEEVPNPPMFNQPAKKPKRNEQLDVVSASGDQTPVCSSVTSKIRTRTEILSQIKQLFELKEIGAISETEYQDKKTVLMSDLN